MKMQSLVLLLAFLAMAMAFKPIPRSARQNMQLYEDFDLSKTTIISDPLIFSEKQLRENLPEDEPRWNPFAAFLPDLSEIFAGGAPKQAVSSNTGSVASSLKKTISPEVLESRTAAFVTGSVNAKDYYKTLNTAFGDKLNKVLPDIIASLPSDKAAALKKVSR